MNKLIPNVYIFIFTLLLLFGANVALAQAQVALQHNTKEVSQSEQQSDPKAISLVRGALKRWRGLSSYAEVSMTIHRPDWQRSMSMVNWTRGDKDALIRFTAPKKDAGNATLKLNNNMWMFTPKLNQVIKLPASMMTQSWMGSDFSYNDLAKSDQLVDDFILKIIATEPEQKPNQTQDQKHKTYTISAFPKPDAPVVWGKEVIVIRDDNLLLNQQFYDQSFVLVKEMKTLKIAPLDGRAYPVVMRMINQEQKDHWTEIVTQKAYFNIELANFIFTQANLRNPRRWQIEQTQKISTKNNPQQIGK